MSSSTPAPQGRASLACAACRKGKVRCSGEHPCHRCNRLQRQCVFPTSSHAGSPNSSIHFPAQRQQSREVAEVLPQTRKTTPDRLLYHNVTDPAFFDSQRKHNSQNDLSPGNLGEPPLTGVAGDVRPPFSDFTYTGQPTGNTSGSSRNVPMCARPFPDMLDPIQCGILDEVSAKWLFEFFMRGPGVHLACKIPNYDELQSRSSYLFSVILCIAYINTSILDTLTQPDTPSMPLEEAETASFLRDLSHNFLARTMLRRPVSLDDICATLLMALWNVTREAAGGPSSWPTIGHAQRMCRRIGHDEAPLLSDAWLIYTDLDTFDHMYCLGYGRPLSNDRPQHITSDQQLLDHPERAKLCGVIARSELVQPIRHLVRWVKRSKSLETPTSSLSDLLGSLNDDLDAWAFRWTSKASPLSRLWGNDKAFSLLLAHHVRLSLNILPGQVSSKNHLELGDSISRKAFRNAQEAAVAIVDLFSEHTTLGNTALTYAPGIAGSILAHAVLYLSQMQDPTTTSGPSQSGGYHESSGLSTGTKEYFEIGLDIMKGDLSNQGYFSKQFAKTIEMRMSIAPSRMSEQPVIDDLNSNAPTLDSISFFQTDPTELMTWLTSGSTEQMDTYDFGQWSLLQ